MDQFLYKFKEYWLSLIRAMYKFTDFFKRYYSFRNFIIVCVTLIMVLFYSWVVKAKEDSRYEQGQEVMTGLFCADIENLKIVLTAPDFRSKLMELKTNRLCGFTERPFTLYSYIENFTTNKAVFELWEATIPGIFQHIYTPIIIDRFIEV